MSRHSVSEENVQRKHDVEALDSLSQMHSCALLAGDGRSATFGDYVTTVVVKELWAAGLRQQAMNPPVSFDPAATVAQFHSRVPGLASDILDAARGWIPIAAEVLPTSLLPDLDHFPASALDEDGLSVTQRRLLLESLDILLEAFLDADGLGELDVPELPRASLASITSQIAAALEHFMLLNHRDTAAPWLKEPDLDVASWGRICQQEPQKSVGGSKQELLEELQRSRNQVFSVERDMAQQERNAKSNLAKQKNDSDKSIAQLSLANRLQEERLKHLGEQYQSTKAELCTLERRFTHLTRLVEEKSRRIHSLEGELSRAARLQEELLQREREYGKKILRLRVEEFAGLCRDHQRKKRLKNAILNMEVSHIRDAIGIEDLTVRKQDSRPPSRQQDSARGISCDVYRPHSATSDEPQNFLPPASTSNVASESTAQPPETDPIAAIMNKVDADPTLNDLEQLACITLKEMETEFEEFFDQRQRLFATFVQESETALTEKQGRTSQVHQEILQAHKLALKHAGTTSRMVHSSTQTIPAGMSFCDEGRSPSTMSSVLPSEDYFDRMSLTMPRVPGSHRPRVASPAKVAYRSATPSTRASSRTSCVTPLPAPVPRIGGFMASQPREKEPGTSRRAQALRSTKLGTFTPTPVCLSSPRRELPKPSKPGGG